ncbi:NAD(P)H-dependent flavin oxidoreductase [Alteribacter aurantiacus]|uniref:NAD(P)H-dependent flavin oxidoreductase n=1 Tax=Alteribacter aurantiacus TaxID=254410 RepID=UPI0004252AE7|nr:nitronate monooxygenase [Alteribacter aurantiacus]
MNRLVGMLHINYPIIQGGMGNISHALLTAAVSEAGGLGTFGAGTFSPEHIEDEIKKIKALTNRPFAVNIPIRVQPNVDAVIETVLRHNVPVVSLSAGNPKPFIQKLKEKGITIMVVVASVNQACKAELAGADIIVAEGYEAAGINSIHETTTLTLIPQIVDAVSIPVVAAGGIGDGRGIAAAICLGAQGVQMGTRFIATKEAVVHDSYKKKILDSTDIDTVVVGRGVGKVRRLLKTAYAEKLISLEKSGLSLEEFEKKTDESHHILGAIEGKLDLGHINGGQIAGVISDIPSVEELLTSMVSEYQNVIGRLQYKKESYK